MNNNILSTLRSQIQLDFRSGLPIYIQIMNQIESRVTSGVLRPGDQLPTVRALAQELRVNFNTVARAYRLLDNAGVISTQQGRGTYILEIPAPEILEKSRQQSLHVLTTGYLAEAAQLGFLPEDILTFFEEQVARWKKAGSLTQSDENDERNMK